jgi:site-specific recombinase XerD
VHDFGQYLSRQRGLSSGTLRLYLPCIAHFLEERFGNEVVQLETLLAHDAIDFVRRNGRTLGHSSVKHHVTALRAFLRYLRHTRQISIDLAACVPSVASWSFSALPKFLLPAQLQLVLDQCDRSTSKGRRDYAIFLLLSRLGLRAGEVAALRLDDLNWEHGHITLRGKGGRWAQLPIPVDVGEAISDYITNGRPSTTDRHVFVRELAPRTGFSASTCISALVRFAVTRAGINSARKGAHLLRHSLATEMLRKGSSLREIGEVLRHRSPDTTQLYAKVDLPSLQELAMPWPGGEQ